MKLTCQSVCRQIDEADSGWQPTGATSEHLSDCASCQQFYDERVKLRQMVGSLGTVAAPADFDFRLRARLANEKAASSRPWFAGSSLRFASVAVAMLVLLLGGVLIFRGMRPANVETPVVKQGSQQAPATPVSPAPPPVVNGDDRGKQTVATVPPDKAKQRVAAPTLEKVAVERKSATKDFSTSAAPVVKSSDQIANVPTVPGLEETFLIDASSEHLKVSLDDASGIQRTISVPRVSFGSQRFISTQPAATKTSLKGDW